MNKRGRQRLEKTQRHRSSEVLGKIALAMERKESSEIRRGLIDEARKSGANFSEIVSATIEGIRKWRFGGGEREGG